MSATIQIADIKATINNYKWRCKNKHYERLLNSMLNDGGPSGSDPNPDYNAALLAVKMIGGKVIDYDLLDYDENAIY